MSHDQQPNHELPAGQSGPSARRKKWLFRAIAAGVPAILGVGVVVAMMIHYRFLVVEPATGRPVVQRPLYLQEPGHEKTGHQYLFDRRLGWRNIPNLHASTFGQPLTINSKGLRDRDYPYEKPAGVYRILVLGDSFTWGYGVADDQIYTEVLETRLADASTPDTQPPVEVLNAGVSGWGTDQEYLFLIDEGFRYAPDVVVLAFFLMNDPAENVSARQYEMNKPLFLDPQLTLANVPVPKPHLKPWFDQPADGLTITLAIMRAMAERCREQGAALAVVKFGRFIRPDDPLLRSDEKAIAAHLSTWPGTHYLDLDRKFEDLGWSFEELTHSNSDGHWNADGHRLTAELLHEFLQQRGLLPGYASSDASVAP